MSAMDPKKRKRSRPAKRIVTHPDKVQDALDRLSGRKLKAQPEPGEKPESKPKPKRNRGRG